MDTKLDLPRWAHLGGRLLPYSEARVGLLTHALLYGTAVFGGLRAYWNDEQEQLYLFRPEDHFRRFLASARMLRMELAATPESLTQAALELLRSEGFRQDAYLRPLAFYADETIGVRAHGLRPEVAIVAIPFGRYLDREEGAHVTVSSWRRVSDNAIPARGKITGSYVNSALAKSDAVLAGFDEALLLNDDGHLCESSAANVFLVRAGVAVTPAITDDVLEGITRATVMQILREELGVSVVERSVDRSELYVADEAFLTGTGVQISAVTRVDHRDLGTGRMGPITARLRDEYFRVVRGRAARSRSWCLPVFAPAADRAPVGALASRAG